MLLNHKKNYSFGKSIIHSTLFLTAMLMCTSTFFKINGVPLFAFFWMGLLILLVIPTKSNYLFLLIEKRKKSHILISAFLLFWILYACLQYIWFANNSYGLNYLSLITINATMLIIILVSSINPKALDSLIKGVIAGGLINVTIACWEISTHSHLNILTEDYERRFYSIPITFFSNANDLATFLFFALILMTIETVKTKNKKYKMFLYFLMLATIFIIFQTHSRGGINGVLIFIGIYIICRLINVLMKKREDILVILAVGISALGTFLLMILILNNSFFSELYNNFGSYLGERLNLWGSSLNMFFNSYLLGAGPGQSLVIANGNVHFFFLEILVEYGLIIFLGFGIIILYLLMRILPIINTKINSIIFSLGIAFIPISISSSSITKIYAVWIIFGIIMAIKLNRFEEEDF